MQLFFSLPKSSIIQRHFNAILVKKPTAKMNSIAFTQNDIVLQLQLQSKPWKLLHTIIDKTQVSFRQFAWGEFHPHLLASLTLISMKKKITVRLPGVKNIPFYPARTGINLPFFQLARRSFRFPSQLINQCNFSQLAQIPHEERVFCRAAQLGSCWVLLKTIEDYVLCRK